MKRSGIRDRRSIAGLALIAAALACARENVAVTPGPITPASTSAAPTVEAGPTFAPAELLPSPTPVGDPPPTSEPTSEAVIEIIGPATRLLPDGEVVYGPSAAAFDLPGFVESQSGYLADYAEPVGSENLSGAQIVQLVAHNYSVNPRLLLALLENQTGWVTNPEQSQTARIYPLNRQEAGREGLYRQLTWAADTLNRAYYGWRNGSVTSIFFTQEQRIVFDPSLNAGTVALQSFYAQYYVSEASWLAQLGPAGISGTYRRLFGDPFAFPAPDPLVPPDLIQLPLSWPWAPSETWYFTGGPHGAYESGSAWAALDFSPPGPAAGCAPSSAWLRASAPGIVVRSDHGVLVIDLDFDGYEQTGWALFYLHVDSRDRAPVGTPVNTGDPVGHPGCEGGSAKGTHLHLARKYNGEWIPAVGPPPFDLSGWTPTSRGVEYSGDLVGDYVLSACECRSAVNAIKVTGR